MTNPAPTIVQIPLHQIIIPEAQTIRAEIDQTSLDELARSMQEIGQMQPITVTAAGKAYNLVAGARRFHAARKLHWEAINAIVTTADEATSRVMTFSENVIRTDLSPVEEAHALQSMLDKSDPDVDHLAQRIGKTRAWIDSRLEILSWPPSLQAAVHAGRVNAAAAKHLAKIPEELNRDSLIEQAAAAGISARTASLWLQQALAQHQPTPENNAPNRVIPTDAALYQTQVRCYFCGTMHPLDQVCRLIACTPCHQTLAKTIAETQAQDRLQPQLNT